MADHKQKRPKGRTNRMPDAIQRAVNNIKQAEAAMLQKGLDATDGGVAENCRAIAVGLDYAAVLVLAAFDSVSRKPSL